MKINPISNNYNSNSSFKGSIDKPLVNWVKALEQQESHLKFGTLTKKNCDKFLNTMEKFMAKTSDTIILTAEKTKICENTGHQLHGLFFKDIKTEAKIVADNFVVPATKTTESKNVSILLFDNLILEKYYGKLSSFSLVILNQWATIINKISSPEEVDLALKAIK